MTDKYVVIGCINEIPEIYSFTSFLKGKQTAKKLKEAPAWELTWEGSLTDLIAELKDKPPKAIIA